MADLKQIYREWRKMTEEQIADGLPGSTDCGLASVREDFSNYAELEEEITFDDMMELEAEYDKEMAEYE